MALASCLEQVDRLLQSLVRLFEIAVLRGGAPGALQELGPLVRLLGELRGLGEVARGLTRGRERCRPVGGPRQRRPRLRLQRRRVRVARPGAIGVEVVRGDHGRDLLVAVPAGPEVRGHREMAGFPLPDRERLVRDSAQEVLSERELVSLGRERVDLDRQDLLAEQ